MVSEGIEGREHLVVEIGDGEGTGVDAAEGAVREGVESSESAQEDALARSIGPEDDMRGFLGEERVDVEEGVLATTKGLPRLDGVEEHSVILHHVLSYSVHEEVIRRHFDVRAIPLKVVHLGDVGEWATRAAPPSEDAVDCQQE